MKKALKYMLCCAVLCLLISCKNSVTIQAVSKTAGTKTAAASETKKTGSKKKKSKKKPKPSKYRGLVTVKGVLYYYDQEGYPLVNKWIRIDRYMRRTDDKGALRTGLWTVPKSGNTYYFDTEGKLMHGWQKISGYYYFFRHGSGVMEKNTAVDGVNLNKKGRAIVDASNSRYLAVYVTARKIAETLTNPSMSNAQRKWACFQWVMNKPYINRPGRLPFRNYKGFEIDNAMDILTGGGGTCFADASAFAFLAHALGIKKVSVCTDTGHCWCDINGYIYDPLLYEGWHNTNYYGKIMTGGHHKAAVRVYIGS